MKKYLVIDPEDESRVKDIFANTLGALLQDSDVFNMQGYKIILINSDSILIQKIGKTLHDKEVKFRIF